MNLSKIIVSLAVFLSLVAGVSAKNMPALRTLNGAAVLEGNKDRKFVKGMQRRRLNGKVRLLFESKDPAFLSLLLCFPQLSNHSTVGWIL